MAETKVSPENSALIPNYTYWRDALAGKKPKCYMDSPELGFYRKGVYKKEENKRAMRIGWVPVAIFLGPEKELVAVIGPGLYDNRLTVEEMKNVARVVTLTDRDKIDGLWSSIADKVVSEDWYRAVADRGEPWPDEPLPIPAANREVAPDDNAPPAVASDVDHATAIDNAIAVALKTVTSEAEAAQAAGSKNRIAELRLAADKAGKAIYEPMYRVYTAEQKKWSPMVARAAAEEKRLNTAILTFRQAELQKAAAAAAEIARKQQAQDEANERAAQRAIARGEPEAPPVVETAPEPTPVLAPVLPTYGTRKVKEEIKKFAVIEDWGKVFAHFQSDQELRDRLEKLATEAIRFGATVPGATHREGLL